MTVRASKGLRNGVLAVDSLAALLAAAELIIYGGTGVPNHPEDAINTGTNPILFQASSIAWDTAGVANGILSKTGTVSATAVAGTPLFYRICETGDDGTAADPGDESTIRFQGDVGIDLILNNASFPGGTETIDHINIYIPEALFA